MKMTLIGLLLFVLYGVTTGQTGVKVHVHVPDSVTCAFAQSYCKLFFSNLSTISKTEDLKILEEAAGGTYNYSWINSQENVCKALKSEDTTISDVKYLLENRPFCAFASRGHWKKTSCENTYSFFCHENFILVQEEKTWDEALVYCRSYYADLASFSYGWPVNQIESETDNALTDSVWTGLRFMNGNWFWLNVINGQNNLPLPSCPTEPYRCGARNTKTEQWENRDCEEKLSFLCLYN
ncbi:macrophage mannose receptor 1-like protein [Labeo rohita]|uniref:Macrophage mannose receptor 1-like protein n=1 Tax=Labeo rohita TaxID=84645 RepID=A0A498MY17_LABRO|nr:macrophage mannose receptor 1-like protein [Labeo rohita]